MTNFDMSSVPSGDPALRSEGHEWSPQNAANSAVLNKQHAVRVVIVALRSASFTGIFGPAEVFAKANALLGQSIYQVQIVTATKQEPKTSFDATVNLHSIFSDLDPAESIDTLLVAGGTVSPRPNFRRENSELLDWLRIACRQTRRFGSFCSGSMVLAEAGLLYRKQATTHWSLSAEMASSYPDVEVLPDRIYVKDGNCYTAAGGTTAVDLALALIEEDCGTEVVFELAKHSVLFLRRSGEQPQLSTTLLAQTSPVGSIHNLLVWMADNLDKDLSVAKLSRRVAMSQRNFSRQFLRYARKTPGKHVVDLRLEAAQRNLTNTNLSLTDVARISGFTSAEVLRRLFGKKFGTSPGRYRNIERRSTNSLQCTPVATCSAE
jgi:transcriptional regulator GlxA family with amidase domain